MNKKRTKEWQTKERRVILFKGALVIQNGTPYNYSVNQEQIYLVSIALI